MSKNLKTSRETLDDRIRALAARNKLDSWNSYVETLELPADLYAALLTGRPELLRLSAPRAMSAEEAGKLLKAIAVLIDTNMALQEHARELAGLVDNWMGMLTGLRGTAGKIEAFAHFRHGDAAAEEDGE